MVVAIYCMLVFSRSCRRWFFEMILLCKSANAALIKNHFLLIAGRRPRKVWNWSFAANSGDGKCVQNANSFFVVPFSLLLSFGHAKESKSEMKTLIWNETYYWRLSVDLKKSLELLFFLFTKERNKKIAAYAALQGAFAVQKIGSKTKLGFMVVALYSMLVFSRSCQRWFFEIFLQCKSANAALL